LHQASFLFGGWFGFLSRSRLHCLWFSDSFFSLLILSLQDHLAEGFERELRLFLEPLAILNCAVGCIKFHIEFAWSQVQREDGTLRLSGDSVLASGLLPVVESVEMHRPKILNVVAILIGVEQ
jgi:hypothetical protein